MPVKLVTIKKKHQDHGHKDKVDIDYDHKTCRGFSKIQQVLLGTDPIKVILASSILENN